MSKHRRGNSDLAGFKNLKNLKRSFNSEKETVGRINRTFSSVESIKGSPTGKVVGSPETPGKKYATHQLVKSTLQLAQHFFEEEESEFFDTVKIYLKQGWEQSRKLFIEHLNKLPYIEQGMQKKTYTEIEEQVIKEWKRNPVLYELRASWYQSLQKRVFYSIGELMKVYNNFRDFVGQVAYLYFRNFFSTLENKGGANIIDRLTERTAHFIITSSSTWGKIFDQIIAQLLRKKLVFEEEIEKVEVREFPLETLELNKNAVDVKEKKLQLPQTTACIDKFMKETKIYEKIKLLKEIREKLEEEIKSHQERMIKNKALKDYKILDKDDFISCLIYCVVRGQLNFRKFGISIKYFHYVLGTDFSEVLSKFACDSYLADLEAVLDFLSQWREKIYEGRKKKSLDEIEIINYSKGKFGGVIY